MTGAPGDHARRMDAVYAHQRHVYDATRKYYLLGRDALIADLHPPPGGSVLEIACGTGRNLVALCRRYPEVRGYGLDVSGAMLETARSAIARAGLEARVTLAQADATCFDPAALFGRARFDRVVISYALSMMPPWRAALRRAAGVVEPGGSLHLVDFGDGRHLPRLFNAALRLWLARFHVSPRDDLAEAVAAVAGECGLIGETRARYRGYAVAARLASGPEKPL